MGDKAMDVAGLLFDNLDHWRNLPSYQLERRADAFFSVYLPGALRTIKGLDVQDVLVPEFPVHKRFLPGYHGSQGNRSVKIDYLAVARDVGFVAFIELKTEPRSRSTKQDAALKAAQSAGMRELGYGLLDLCKATKADSKYGHLLKLMANAGLVLLPEHFEASIRSRDKSERKRAFAQIVVRDTIQQCHIVYVQLGGKGEDVINFAELADFVEELGDPVSLRFARSLREWRKIPAGQLAL